MNNTRVLPIYPTLLMPMTYYLGVDCFILTLQILSASGNGFIIFLFLRTKRLRKNKALWLLLYLSVTDFIFALSIFPYMIYFASSWNPVVFDYNALFTVISSAPVVIQFKINTVITIMIGVDRIQAISLPVYYRSKNHVLFIFITFGLGIGLATIDVCFEFITTNFNIHRYNCSALGCFQNPIFQEYWGISNMTLDVIGLFFTSWVTWKIHYKSHKSTFPHGSETKEMKQMSQANRLCVGIFMVSFIFLTIPSTTVGIAQFAKLAIFQIFGPFYAIGLLLAGIFNSIIYITLHTELRRAAVDFKHEKLTQNESTFLA